MSEPETAQTDVGKAVQDFTLVAFGIQLTLIGLFDGSSFLVIVVGVIFGILGILHPLMNLS